MGKQLGLYCAWLHPSLANLQVLDEFYQELRSVGVSALTGEGMDDFFAGVLSCGEDYHKFYKPDLDMRKQVSSGVAVICCCSRLNWNTGSRLLGRSYLSSCNENPNAVSLGWHCVLQMQRKQYEGYLTSNLNSTEAGRVFVVPLLMLSSRDLLVLWCMTDMGASCCCGVCACLTSAAGSAQQQISCSCAA